MVKMVQACLMAIWLGMDGDALGIPREQGRGFLLLLLETVDCDCVENLGSHLF